jgi:predicted O-methyltransferase YrrM
MELIAPEAEAQLREFVARYDEPVLLEMEREAERLGFPIVGRVVGVMLELLARAVRAQRIFEMGSGFGYSAYWFSRAAGPDAEIHLTDGNPEFEAKATDYLDRAGLFGPIRFHVGDAIEEFQNVDGDFDLIFNDVDKGDYPRVWEAARERIRVGGLYICDNAIQAGDVNVLTGEDGSHPGWARAIDQHNRAVVADTRYVTTLVPIRDGDLVAIRIA